MYAFLALFFILSITNPVQAKTFDFKEVNILVGTEVSYYPGVARYPEKKLTTALPLGGHIQVFGTRWVGVTTSFEGHLSFESERYFRPFIQNEIGVIYKGGYPQVTWSAGFLQQFWRGRYTPGLIAHFNFEVGHKWEVSASVGNSTAPFVGLGLRCRVLSFRESR